MAKSGPRLRRPSALGGISRERVSLGTSAFRLLRPSTDKSRCCPSSNRIASPRPGMSSLYEGELVEGDIHLSTRPKEFVLFEYRTEGVLDDTCIVELWIAEFRYELLLDYLERCGREAARD